jgi:hypothetical protein
MTVQGHEGVAVVQSFPISPKSVRYIKLGRTGMWENECVSKGIIRFGYGTSETARYDICLRRDWDALTKSFLDEGKDQGTATRFTNEVRTFFEDDGTTLWITFVGVRFYWGFLTNEKPTPHMDGHGVFRRVLDGWSSFDALGTELTTDRLAGSLTKLAAYRGTSCSVGEANYVIRRINGITTPQVEAGIAAYAELKAAALGLIRLLAWKDFETLVDLIFTASGWRRLGVVGKTQKSVDLDVVLPSTGERALVQVKSTSDSKELAHYLETLDSAGPYDRLIFVHHSGVVESDDARAFVVGPERVAELVVDAGLVRWLIDKVS